MALHDIAAGQESGTLSDYLHCILIRSSINSISENYTPEHVASALEGGLWNAERALSVASRVPSARKRANMCLALLRSEQLVGELRTRAEAITHEAAKALDGASDRAWMLAELTPRYLGELDRHLVYTALAALDEDIRTAHVIALAGYLTVEGVAAALDILIETRDDSWRVQ